MAQFNADILLAVRGSEKAKKEIEKLELAVDKLGKKLNLDIGGQIRLKGEQSLLKVRVKNFGILQKELKVSQQIAREASKLARVQGNPNQYGGPIGPGQASPSRLSSSLAQKRNERTQERIRERARGLNQYSSGIFPKPDLNKEIQKRSRLRSIARSTARIRDQGLSKSVFQTKLELQLATKLSGVEKLITAEQQKQISAQQSLAKQREKALDKASRQYRKPIGPELPKAKKRGGGGGAGGGLAAGIGFPLLFGGGPGSVIGGALGSAGGFGTQILASAIGGIIDQAVAGVAKLGQALNPLTADIDAVVAAAGESGTAFGQLVKDLEKVAGKEKALAAATAQLATVIGQDGVSALKEFGDESAELGRVYAETLSQISAAVADLINNSGFLTALAKRLERTNLVNSGLRNDTKDAELTDLGQEYRRAEKGKGERSLNTIENELVARAKAVQLSEQQNVKDATNAEILKQKAADAALTNNILQAQIDLAESGLDLTTAGGVALAEKVIKQEFIAEKQKLINEGLDIETAELNKQLALLNLKAKQAAAVEAAARKAEAAARKAANEEKRLAREAEQARKQELRVQQQLAQIGGQFITDSLKLIEIQNGKKARLEAELEANILIFQTKAKEIQLSDQDIRIQQERLALLDKQAFTRQEELKAQLAQIAAAERLAEIESRQSVENTRASLGQELGSLALGLSPELELVNEQANRLTNTIKNLDDQLEKLKAQRIPGVENKELESAIKGIQGQKLAYQELLPAIFAAEQQQLKYNQALAAVTPGVNALVGGLQEVVAGTKTAEEAFADFLNTIADQLINTAATMIAQYLAIAAAKAIAGLKPQPGDQFGPLFTGIRGKATGGPVDGNTPYIVGEKGPELFIPGVSGVISNNDQFNAARDAMSSNPELAFDENNQALGASGSTTSRNSSSELSRSFAENNSSMSMTNSYMRERAMEVNNQTTIGGAGSMVIETQVINEVEYATVDQVAKASALAAKQARAQVFSDMKNKPSKRAMVGMK